MPGKTVPTLIPKKMEVGMAAAQKTQEKLKTPHEIYRQIPLKVSQIVMDCVQENPAKRPENMGEIIARMDILIRQIFGSKFNNAGTRDN